MGICIYNVGTLTLLKYLRSGLSIKLVKPSNRGGSWSPSEFRSKNRNDLKIMHKYFDNIRYVLNSTFFYFVQLIIKAA